jgi:hypothetical protein
MQGRTRYLFFSSAEYCRQIFSLGRKRTGTVSIRKAATDWHQQPPSFSIRALDYLAVEKPFDCSVPRQVDLGAYCFAICAFGPSPKEPVRITLCSNWQADLATKDAAQWLRTFIQDNQPLN